MTMDIVKERQHDSFCPVKQAEAVLYVVEFKPMAARFLEGIWAGYLWKQVQANSGVIVNTWLGQRSQRRKH